MNQYDSLLRQLIERLNRVERRVGLVDTLESGYIGLTGTETVAGVKNFTDGIKLNNGDTLAVYTSGTWSPVITGSVSNPTVTYTENVGRYSRIGNIVFYSFRVVINTYSGGSGNLRVSLPLTNSNVNAADLVRSAANLSGVDVTATTPYGLHFRPELGAAYGIYQIAADNAATVTTAVGDAAAGDTISASGWYWV